MALLLDQTAVRRVLDMKSAMQIVEQAFAELDAGSADLPQRTPIDVPRHEGLALFMPASMSEMGALGAKIVTVYKHNPARFSLPAILGVIVLLDPKSGRVDAIMEASYLTAMRTGAASGVATRHMARENAKVGAVIGSGVQARTQALAICQARPLEKVRVFSLESCEQIRAFCDDVSEQVAIPVEAAASAEEAVRDADVVALATSSSNPVIDGRRLASGCHINAVGSHTPATREVDEWTATHSRIICDQTSACLQEAGDLLIPIRAGQLRADAIAGELGAVVRGGVPGRTAEDQLTLFKSVGLAIQDMSTALVVCQRARAQGIGQEIDL